MASTHLRTGPNPELPFIHVDYQGQRYKVEVFQQTHEGTHVNLLQTTHCPWHLAAKSVINYLDHLSQTTDDFELTPDVPIDVEIGQAPSDQPVPIRSVRYYPSSTKEEATKIDSETIKRTNTAMERQLLDLNHLMHPPKRPSAAPPTTPFQQGDPLPELEFPRRRYPSPPQLPAAQHPYQPNYYPNQLLVETGGGGDCGASALADAHFQFKQEGFASKKEWEKALGAQKTFLREDTAQYLYDTIAEDEEAMNSFYFVQEILPNIRNNQEAITGILTSEQRRAFEFLMNKIQDSLTPKEKGWLTQCYACYTHQQGILLEEPFLRAYAIQHQIPIAVITASRGVLQIQKVIPQSINDDFVKTIQPTDVLFLHCEGLSHYRSVQLAHQRLNDLIQDYNQRTQRMDDLD